MTNVSQRYKAAICVYYSTNTLSEKPAKAKITVYIYIDQQIINQIIDEYNYHLQQRDKFLESYYEKIKDKKLANYERYILEERYKYYCDNEIEPTVRECYIPEVFLSPTAIILGEELHRTWGRQFCSWNKEKKELVIYRQKEGFIDGKSWREVTKKTKEIVESIKNTLTDVIRKNRHLIEQTPGYKVIEMNF